MFYMLVYLILIECIFTFVVCTAEGEITQIRTNWNLPVLQYILSLQNTLFMIKIYSAIPVKESYDNVANSISVFIQSLKLTLL